MGFERWPLSAQLLTLVRAPQRPGFPLVPSPPLPGTQEGPEEGTGVPSCRHLQGLNLTVPGALWGSGILILLTDVETEAQRGGGICTKSGQGRI